MNKISQQEKCDTFWEPHPAVEHVQDLMDDAKGASKCESQLEQTTKPTVLYEAHIMLYLMYLEYRIA